MAKRVFICGTYHDSKLACAVFNKLNEWGCDYFFTSDDLLNECKSFDCFIMLVSEHSICSQVAEEQLKIAIDANIKIISVDPDRIIFRQLQSETAPSNMIINISRFPSIAWGVDTPIFDHLLRSYLHILCDKNDDANYEKKDSLLPKNANIDFKPEFKLYDEPFLSKPLSLDHYHFIGGFLCHGTSEDNFRHLYYAGVMSKCLDWRCESAISNQSSKVKISEVMFSTIAPKLLIPSEYSIIDIIMFEDKYRRIVDKLLECYEPNVKEEPSGFANVKDNSLVRIVLHSPDINIDENRQQQLWIGKYLRFSFAIMLPDDYIKKQVLFNADIYINDVIATKLKFTIECKSNKAQKPATYRTDILSAFVSYSSLDRLRVVSIIQGMRKARPDLDVFLDVERIRSGENWKDRLTHEIDIRDVLYLCWSRNASKSEMVDYEWRYALSQKGIDGVEPIPLEPSNTCPPPVELKSKHFNDSLLYIINACE